MRRTRTVRADQLQRGDVIIAVQYGDSPGEWAPRNRIGERVTRVRASDEPGGPALLASVRWRSGVYTFGPDETVEIKDK